MNSRKAYGLIKYHQLLICYLIRPTLHVNLFSLHPRPVDELFDTHDM